MEQIEKMDLIYWHAEATIIAAAGDGPFHGLPGVRKRRNNCLELVEYQWTYPRYTDHSE